jgi:potassium/hydrogen antiporter
MDKLAAFFPDLLVVSALLLGAVALAPLVRRVGLPAPAAFLGAGIVAGLLHVLPADEVAPLRLEQIGAVALYAILFQGGLATGFRAWRSSARPILLLGLPGTAATAAAIAAAAHFLLGLEWTLAGFVGIALAPTDPAAVYSVLRDGAGRSRARAILEGESGFNDPVGISLMVVAVLLVAEPDAGIADGALRFAEELLIGIAGGAIGGILLAALVAATPRLDEAIQGAAVLVGAIIVGAATASLHGSGFLAVYVSGLLIADRWARQDGRNHALPEAASGISEPVLFGLLGASFAPLVGLTQLWQGLILTLITVFAVRPLVAAACLSQSRLTAAERVLVSWGGLKGAVPLLLAAYPALENLNEATATMATVLVATAASILIQGATLKTIAARAGTRSAVSQTAGRP